jgi:hypothetical protein
MAQTKEELLEQAKKEAKARMDKRSAEVAKIRENAGIVVP